MRTVLSPKLIKIAHVAASIPGVKAILKPLYYRYKESIKSNRNKAFLESGLSVLDEFDKIMCSNKIKYVMTAGSMLGAVREHGFIKHDFDIDTAIWASSDPDRIQQLLESHGFVLCHSFRLDNGKLAREDTFEKKHVAVDIFYIYDDGVQYHCDFQSFGDSVSWSDSMSKYGHIKCRRVEIPFSEEIVRVPFENIEVNVPANYNEWLSKRYGADYMIPNPGWSNGNHPFIKEWAGMKPIFIGEK